MGFWHTGYSEFHEPTGLEDFPWDPSPPKVPCSHCDEIFDSIDDLRRHLFESHPRRRPVLFVKGRELGAHPVRITQALAVGEVTAIAGNRAILNGDEIELSTLPLRLTRIASDVCRVTLSRNEVSAEFTLDFRIASEADLRGVEAEFQRTALGGHLDIRAIEEFISAASRFGSAIGYCDGICAYLYGVLAKERASDSSLPYEAYVGKFNRAAEELDAYKRPLARMIGSIIKFHFNHFEEASCLAGDSRLGRAARRYATWLQSRVPRMGHNATHTEVPITLDTLVTDWETEQIVRWAVQPLRELAQHTDEMQLFLSRNPADHDRVKVNVLVGECFAASGDIQGALRHARSLRNLPGFEGWSESMIRTYAEGANEQH